MFKKDTHWAISRDEISVEKLREVAQLFYGQEYNYQNFVKIRKDEPDPFGYKRTIESIKVELIEISGSEQELVVTIKSRGFMWHQIRIMMFYFI